MARLQHEININAPIEKVWDILTNLEEVGKYNSLVTSVKYISENKTGVGASRECQLKPRGYAKEKVTGIQDQVFISMEMYESEWPLKYMRWTNHLSSTDGSTTVKTVTEYQLKFGFLGSLMDNFAMKPKFNKILDELHRNMKQYMETK